MPNRGPIVLSIDEVDRLLDLLPPYESDEDKEIRSLRDKVRLMRRFGTEAGYPTNDSFLRSSRRIPGAAQGPPPPAPGRRLGHSVIAFADMGDSGATGKPTPVTGEGPPPPHTPPPPTPPPEMGTLLLTPRLSFPNASSSASPCWRCLRPADALLPTPTPPPPAPACSVHGLPRRGEDDHHQ